LAKTPRTWTGARTPSGLKRVRQAERRHAILQPRRSAAKTFVSKAITAATSPVDGLDPAEALRDAFSALDRAAKAGAIHPNAAARRKSRLAIKVNAALEGGAVQTGARAKTTGKAAAVKAAKARIAAGRADKAKGAQTAAGKARAALSRTARSEAGAGQGATDAAAPKGSATRASRTASPNTPAKTAAAKTGTATKAGSAGPKATKAGAAAKSSTTARTGTAAKAGTGTKAAGRRSAAGTKTATTPSGGEPTSEG
jgi:DNA-binding protein HU-beta